jgi:amino acid adenylation domain-containing protein/non-ribosomal peptide synthase protein (TIGR01720 family)
MTLLAGFQVLLSRYSNQADVAVGTPIANRNRLEVEPLIGFFVNTLVLRSDLSSECSFGELLGRVRDTVLGAYAHQDLPFEKLAEELQVERDLSRTPLFQVMFTLESGGREQLRLPGLSVESLQSGTQEAKFDLSLAFQETHGGLVGSMGYATSLFRRETVERMAAHLRTLLESLPAEPERPVQHLPLLSEAEQQRLLVELNTAEPFNAGHGGVHQLFEAQAARAPQAVAAVWGQERLTYGQLNGRANQLAHHLRSLGVGPEVTVGICLERSLDALVALLAVLKAGGAYVPLDPEYPDERLAFIVRDTGLSILLSHSRLAERLRQHEATTVCLDAKAGGIGGLDEGNPVSSVGGENIAYVIYTSGSTGRPKGVLVRHAAVCNIIQSSLKAYHVGARSRVLQVASLSFDASVLEIFMALSSGAALYMAGRDLVLSSEDLTRLIRDEAITTAALTPALLEFLPTGPFPALRTVLTGGDSCPPETAARWSAGRELFNVYAPTEATIYCTRHLCEPGSGQAPPIGRPVAGTRVYLLDARLQPVPTGVPGELHIGGGVLARGYFKLPALTAERFIPDPFGAEPGARLYKSGDLARYLPDGQIEFLGRVDHQVKVRGYRIELGEIEATLRRHEGLREVLVMVREDEPGDKRLAAYVVAQEQGPRPSGAELREYLRGRLPDYMVPSHFVFLERLPLTPTGKLDRKALPRPERENEAGEYAGPRTPAEEILCAVWAKVLKLKRVGIHDNFFELGGDSILSIQIVSRANQAGLNIKPKHVFQHQTIAELAKVAGSAAGAAEHQGLVSGPVPLTPIQRLFLERELPDPNHFNQSVFLRPRQQLDPQLLQAAVRQLLVHHDALRLRFNRRDSAWEQFNAGTEGRQVFNLFDLSEVPAPQRVETMEAEAAALQKSLDLAEGPIVRAAYFDLGAGDARLLLIVHHLAVDGVSWRILLEDLEIAYRQLAKGEPVRLPAKTTSFKRWSEELTKYTQSRELARESLYWLAPDRGRAEPLPRDFPGGSNTSDSRRLVVAELDEEQTRKLLQEAPKQYGAQIEDLLLSALVESFARWTGSQSLTLDMEGHGREDLLDGLDISRTVGWFTTIYPVFLRRDSRARTENKVQAIREQLKSIPRRGIGYGLLKYLTEDEAVRARLRHMPSAEVSFNYLGQLDKVLDTETLFTPAREAAGAGQTASGMRSHLLEFDSSVRGGKLYVYCVYSQNLHREATVRRLADGFIRALEEIIAEYRPTQKHAAAPPDVLLGDVTEDELSDLLSSLEVESGD